MIDLAALRAKKTPFEAVPLTLHLGPGTHAFLGRPEDGGPALLATLGATQRAAQGRATVVGHALGSPAARRAVAYVPPTIVLPDALRVEEVLAVASAIRGEPASPVTPRLTAMGIAHLARRAAKSLSSAEARAVALAEALTSSVPVLLLDEPLTGLEPQAAQHVRAAIVARGKQQGSCVVVATASIRDASDLADDVLILDRGALVRRSGPSDGLALGVTLGVRIRVLCTDPRALASVLAMEPATRALEADAEGAVIASGASLGDVAAAVGRAALRAQVDLHAITPEAASLEEVRAAASGDAAGTYRAAFERARAASLAAQQGPSS
jgi:ABC-type multidrug transport system ATPase subunit